ncbi:MAG: hypothetical protein JST36_07095 [Bacteroidetes bacterium]|nr:hypothetical protein [Bacteroidota bacterium]
MKPFFLLFVALGCVLLSLSCQKGSNSGCNTQPAGEGIKFRFTDTMGNDLLVGKMARMAPASLVVTQPCNTTPIGNVFSYTTNGRDSISFLQLKNFQTPVYGAPGNCFRVFFQWGSDTDTLDWHYKIEENDGCKNQIIDYMLFNSLKAKLVNANGTSYYQCIKP